MTYRLSSIQFFRRLAAVCVLSSITIIASAESGERPNHKPGPEHLIEALQVTEDQQDMFVTIMKAQHEKRMSIHEQYRGNHEEERSSMTSLHEETLVLLQDVLTAEQLEAFATMEKQRPARKPRN